VKLNWFNNLKIMSRLLTGFIIVAVLAGVVGYVGITNIHELNANDIKLYEENTVPLTQLRQITDNFQQTRSNLLLLILANTPEKRAEVIKKLADRKNEISKAAQEFEKHTDAPEIKQAYAEFLEQRKAYGAMADQVTGYVNSGNTAAALQLVVGNGDQVWLDYEASVNKLVELKVRDAEKRASDNKLHAETAIRLVTVLNIGAFIVAIFFGWVIARSVSRPVKKMVMAMKKLALGDVTATVEVDSSDEIGDLAKSLQAVVTNINGAASAAEKLASGDLTLRLKEQSDKDILGQSINRCVANINLLANDTNLLVQAALAGKLEVRADVSKHSGDFRKIVEGVNSTLDAVIAPVKETAIVLQKMAQGNLQDRVKGDYKGDHAQLKNAMNDTIEALDNYVGEISEVLRELANSNLKVGIANDYKGDFVHIKDALNLIINALNDVFGEINNASDQVAAGARQVSDGSQALSQGATEQASAIEELTVSIGQIAAQTKDNAVNAAQASNLAQKVKESAEQGNFEMKEMLKSMEEINESSANISKIIKVIDEIAFQTNILALNAAVEAARAGQHGKGFAVVAEEVRNLAARSANAAKETTFLIEGSIKKVEDGTEIATITAKALDEIVTGVTKAADLVEGIAGASSEQATAIAQINKGVEQVAQVVQTNSATAEESAAASEELSGQAEILKDMIASFKLKEDKRNFMSDSELEYDNKRELGGRQINRAAYGAFSSKPKIALSDSEFGKY